MGQYQLKLEYEQVILGNFVDIGTDLFVMASSLAYAEHLLKEDPSNQTPQELVDLFCSEARRRIASNFAMSKQGKYNKKYTKVANLLMDGKLLWLAKDAFTDVPPKYRDYAKNDYEHPETKLTKEKKA